ncbi:hypothetical protein C8N43_2425 [Litoreibacter ponti]|uniref:Methyltransferase family protein n=1 Tax=Litoreibacter ponti TaxID=1510457 RepID=A0A2T6BNY8_9RHOB|nr:class I SAM-dependent methyltransferase [Litoreibacter ponti]PTX57754.1 hypothetical protein C8N43_2425 [Litoreibacter ponti]
MSDLSRIEAELSKLTRDLGEFLLLPPCDRSTPGFAKIWRPISRYRVALRTALRERGSALANPGANRGSGTEIERQMAFNAASRRLRLWSRIEDMVNKQIMPDRRSLMPPEEEFMSGAHNHYVNHLYSALHTLALPSAEALKIRIADAHPDIALPATHFEALMNAAFRICRAQRREQPPRFLDVGCGGGTKVFAALPFFKESHGLENNPSQAAVAAAVLERLDAPRAKVIEGDARAFAEYSDYDVIYFFRPIKDPDGLRDMEDRIMAQARPGTILIAPYNGFSAERDDMRCSMIVPTMYVVGMGPTQVETLRQRAELIGTEVPAHDAELDASLGYWRPVVAASSQNGYAL